MSFNALGNTAAHRERERIKVSWLEGVEGGGLAKREARRAGDGRRLNEARKRRETAGEEKITRDVRAIERCDATL